jgi:hypothetical protein
LVLGFKHNGVSTVSTDITGCLMKINADLTFVTLSTMKAGLLIRFSIIHCGA